MQVPYGGLRDRLYPRPLPVCLHLLRLTSGRSDTALLNHLNNVSPEEIEEIRAQLFFATDLTAKLVWVCVGVAREVA